MSLGYGLERCQRLFRGDSQLAAVVCRALKPAAEAAVKGDETDFVIWEGICVRERVGPWRAAPLDKGKEPAAGGLYVRLEWPRLKKAGHRVVVARHRGFQPLALVRPFLDGCLAKIVIAGQKMTFFSVKLTAANTDFRKLVSNSA